MDAYTSNSKQAGVPAWLADAYLKRWGNVTPKVPYTKVVADAVQKQRDTGELVSAIPVHQDLLADPWVKSRAVDNPSRPGSPALRLDDAVTLDTRRLRENQAKLIQTTAKAFLISALAGAGYGLTRHVPKWVAAKKDIREEKRSAVNESSAWSKAVHGLGSELGGLYRAALQGVVRPAVDTGKEIGKETVDSVKNYLADNPGLTYRDFPASPTHVPLAGIPNAFIPLTTAAIGTGFIGADKLVDWMTDRGRDKMLKKRKDELQREFKALLEGPEGGTSTELPAVLDKMAAAYEKQALNVHAEPAVGLLSVLALLLGGGSFALAKGLSERNSPHGAQAKALNQLLQRRSARRFPSLRVDVVQPGETDVRTTRPVAYGTSEHAMPFMLPTQSDEEEEDVAYDLSKISAVVPSVSDQAIDLANLGPAPQAYNWWQDWPGAQLARNLRTGSDIGRAIKQQKSPAYATTVSNQDALRNARQRAAANPASGNRQAALQDARRNVLAPLPRPKSWWEEWPGAQLTRNIRTTADAVDNAQGVTAPARTRAFTGYNDINPMMAGMRTAADAVANARGSTVPARPRDNFTAGMHWRDLPGAQLARIVRSGTTFGDTLQRLNTPENRAAVRHVINDPFVAFKRMRENGNRYRLQQPALTTVPTQRPPSTIKGSSYDLSKISEVVPSAQDAQIAALGPVKNTAPKWWTNTFPAQAQRTMRDTARAAENTAQATAAAAKFMSPENIAKLQAMLDGAGQVMSPENIANLQKTLANAEAVTGTANQAMSPETMAHIQQILANSASITGTADKTMTGFHNFASGAGNVMRNIGSFLAGTPAALKSFAGSMMEPTAPKQTANAPTVTADTGTAAPKVAPGVTPVPDAAQAVAPKQPTVTPATDFDASTAATQAPEAVPLTKLEPPKPIRTERIA